MEEDNNTVFYEACRLCLDELGYYDIFEKSELRDNIYECIGIKVSLADNLPQKICEKCLDILNKVTELRSKAIKNNDHLKSLFCYEGNRSPESSRESGTSEIVDNSHFVVKDSQTHPTIKTFIRIRKDLFDSSVPEPSVQPENILTEADSSQDNKKLAKLKRAKKQDIYTCAECSKEFRDRKKYTQHTRLHDKKFKCPTQACNKAFPSKGDLEKHIRTHTGEKPYACDICYKDFSQRGTMKSHKITVHGNNYEL